VPPLLKRLIARQTNIIHSYNDLPDIVAKSCAGMRQDRVFQAAVQVCAGARNYRMRNQIEEPYEICARGTQIVLMSFESSAAMVATELVQPTTPIFVAKR
jgi:hypothetical protein